jgi:hypothetical protein
MSRDAKTSGRTMSAAESSILNVCAVRFPAGAVGAFKLMLHEGAARLLVDDGAGLHGISEMSVDPAGSTKEMSMRLLLSAAEASARRTTHFDLLLRCELLQEGLIDADAFRSLAAWIAMRGVIGRAMDRGS